jgi:small-conductance mechanosensitive channel
MQTIEPNQLLELAKTWKMTAKKGRKCKLLAHNDTIKYLRSARHFSTKQIHKFLNENGVKVAYPTILNYINRKNK